MLFDIGLVIACHFITVNIIYLTDRESKNKSKLARACALMTIVIGLCAIVDLVVKKISQAI